MIYAIYKRYKGSGIADVMIAAGVIAEGSVDQALRGKHNRCALRCLSLMYEMLMHLLVNKKLAGLKLNALMLLQRPNLMFSVSQCQTPSLMSGWMNLELD